MDLKFYKEIDVLGTVIGKDGISEKMDFFDIWK